MRLQRNESSAPLAALLELPFDEVIKKLGGPGRAALVMRALRDGQDPFDDERVGQRTKRAQEILPL